MAAEEINCAPALPDSDEARVRADVIAQTQADPERLISDYKKRFGNVLNADNAATLFAAYNENPAKYRVAVHPAVQWIRDEMFRRALAEPAPEGRNRIVFTSGGNASGKSSALDAAQSGEASQAVLDSTFSNPEHAEKLLEQALAAQKPVTVLYVSRPLGSCLKGMLARAHSEDALLLSTRS